MGLDIKSNSSLWKDKALVELNLAILYTFQVKKRIFKHIITRKTIFKLKRNQTQRFWTIILLLNRL